VPHYARAGCRARCICPLAATSPRACFRDWRKRTASLPLSTSVRERSPWQISALRQPDGPESSPRLQEGSEFLACGYTASPSVPHPRDIQGGSRTRPRSFSREVASVEVLHTSRQNRIFLAGPVADGIVSRLATRHRQKRPPRICKCPVFNKPPCWWRARVTGNPVARHSSHYSPSCVLVSSAP